MVRNEILIIKSKVIARFGFGKNDPYANFNDAFEASLNFLRRRKDSKTLTTRTFIDGCETK